MHKIIFSLRTNEVEMRPLILCTSLEKENETKGQKLSLQLAALIYLTSVHVQSALQIEENPSH